jgi:hypothetical protein
LFVRPTREGRVGKKLTAKRSKKIDTHRLMEALDSPRSTTASEEAAKKVETFSRSLLSANHLDQETLTTPLRH